MTFCLFNIEHLVKTGDREAVTGEMNDDEPSTYEIGKIVEEVSISHTVNSCKSRKEEEKGVGYVAESIRHFVS